MKDSDSDSERKYVVVTTTTRKRNGEKVDTITKYGYYEEPPSPDQSGADVSSQIIEAEELLKKHANNAGVKGQLKVLHEAVTRVKDTVMSQQAMEAEKSKLPQKAHNLRIAVRPNKQH